MQLLNNKVWFPCSTAYPSSWISIFLFLFLFEFVIPVVCVVSYELAQCALQLHMEANIL